MADRHGTMWAVGERECSIQRRHQKVIEESPSPLVERIPGMRAKLFEAARLAAAAIGYTGAGTVEFMADDRGPVLLPGDEHPAAGGTPGHRGDHRTGPGRAADRHRRRQPARAATARGHRAFHRGPALRRGPGQGLAAAGRRRAPFPGAGRAHRVRHPRPGRDPAGFGHRRRFADLGVLRPDAGQGHLLRADPGAGSGGAGRRAGPRPHPRRRHQPAPAGQRAAAPGVPGRRHRHRLLRHPRTGRSGRRAGGYRSAVGAGRRTRRRRPQSQHRNGVRSGTQRLA